VAPFLREALAQGAPAIAVLSRSHAAVLREALGPIADRIHVRDCDGFYVRPARTLAAFDAVLRGCAHIGTPRPRIVGELPFMQTEREWREWIGYEGLFNRTMAGRDVAVLCTYDARRVPDHAIDGARRTHPHTHDGERYANPRYEQPERVLADLDREPQELRGLALLDLTYDPVVYRERLAAALAAAGVAPARALDMLLAATELHANAGQHGGGPTELRAGTVDGWFVCEVTDDGLGLDTRLAGYLPPGGPGEVGGVGTRGARAGLWIARQLVTRLEFIERYPGLTARLWL
jgi:anti-sigma regulatory factor (Ser/Thr protein kinase)